MRIAVICLLLVVGAMMGVSSAGPGCGEAGHHDFDRAPGLTAEQRQKMDDIYESTQKEIIEAQGKMRVKQLEMDMVMKSDNPDMRKIRKLVNEIGDARSASVLARIERQVKMREILGPKGMEKTGRMMYGRAHCDGERFLGPRGHGMWRPGGWDMPGSQGPGHSGRMMQGRHCRRHKGLGRPGPAMGGCPEGRREGLDRPCRMMPDRGEAEGRGPCHEGRMMREPGESPEGKGAPETH
jgi:Spy/CpxP family protein refolding chaperone